MELSLKPDAERAMARHEAFWRREIIDRPPILLQLPRPGSAPRPAKAYATQNERWLDIDERVEQAAYQLEHTDFLYDALPIVFPDMGPEIFSVWCGCGYEYGPRTMWTRPCVSDWETDHEKARFRIDHPLFQKTVEYTRKLIERGRGSFIVGLTDFHPGGDHLAALRDPQALSMDLLDCPEWVAYMMSRSMPEYYAAYGVLYGLIRGAGMPTTSWLPLVHDGTFYIPSCDFSCMISKEMFDRYFLPSIEQECRFYERSIYHLDGPQALRHLDSLLEIKELDAIQYAFGAGHEGFAKWRSTYQKIQRAGKGIWMRCHVSELGEVVEALRPEGVCFGAILGVEDRETADYAARRIINWK